ncbi:hypothetical protein KY359_03655 [Candidatus Woesearchaeota archaeon]|nr:hypothetical protein [Candidatus Woesearchaeota archaeon]
MNPLTLAARLRQTIEGYQESCVDFEILRSYLTEQGLTVARIPVQQGEQGIARYRVRGRIAKKGALKAVTDYSEAYEHMGPDGSAEDVWKEPLAVIRLEREMLPTNTDVSLRITVLDTHDNRHISVEGMVTAGYEKQRDRYRDMVWTVAKDVERAGVHYGVGSNTACLEARL